MARSKSALHLPRVRVGGFKKLVALLVAVALVVLVIRDPVGMAGFFTALGDGVVYVVDGLAAFFKAL